LSAPSQDTAAVLAEHRAELQHALKNAGVTPLGVTVDTDERA
jgi:hypothetical protein